jgi:putative ABC transport system ATP-binding protein
VVNDTDHWPIEIRSISLDRGGRPVLRDVSATFAGRTVTAIVGPSGAGKTSLLRCINRLEEPHEGDVLLDGADVRTLDPTALRKRVGMIFQTPVLFEGGVRANLTYGLDGVPEEAIQAALEAAGLAGSFLERESPALSVGQAQRVCIARALVRKPEALILDEPTSALDLKATKRIEDLLVSLADSGLTIIVVTHDLAQARRIATDALLLDEGRVLAVGTPDDVAGAWPGGAA